MILTYQKGRGTKIHLLLDNEYAVTTDENFWIDNYISNGTDIDEEQWQELLVKINYKKALNKCSELLARRDHSVKELRTKLLRTVDEVSADKAINRYIEAGYLDDNRFCTALVDYLYKVKKFSLNHIKAECFKRGIDRDIISRVLDEYDIDSVDTIVQLINSKYSSKLSLEGGRDKVIAALQRKGFHYSDIISALNRLEDYEL
ncbi:MAG: regulatory protein RecX [Eubacterium sp.]